MLSVEDEFYGLRLLDNIGVPLAEWNSNLELDWSQAKILKVNEGDFITGIVVETDIA